MASGTRGYSSYRGRGRKGKVLLAIFLVLVILASVGFIFAREHMTYDADGELHISFPWAKEDRASAPVEPDGDVTIQEPEPAVAGEAAGAGLLLNAAPLTEAAWETALPDLTRLACRWTAVTLKDAAGWVYFDSDTALPGTVRTQQGDSGTALASLTEWARQTGGHAAARVACFHDPKAANANVESMGLKNTGGYIFYDGHNSQWLDPGKADARTYLTEIIREAAELGFDEILLTDVSYPTEGKLDKIAYTFADDSISEAVGRRASLTAFLTEVRAALPEGVKLSLELDADIIRTGRNEDAGQALTELAPLVDRIYVQTAEAEVAALEEAVTAAAPDCALIPELTEVPTGELESWLLISE